MLWKCDRTPSTGTPTPPPSDAYLDAWMAARGTKLLPKHDLPADVAAFVGGL